MVPVFFFFGSRELLTDAFPYTRQSAIIILELKLASCYSQNLTTDLIRSRVRSVTHTHTHARVIVISNGTARQNWKNLTFDRRNGGFSGEKKKYCFASRPFGRVITAIRIAIHGWPRTFPTYTTIAMEIFGYKLRRELERKKLASLTLTGAPSPKLFRYADVDGEQKASQGHPASVS